MSSPSSSFRIRTLVIAFAALLATIAALTGCMRTKAAAHVANRSTLAEHRQQQIARLHAYAEAGVFPQNPTPTPAPLHIFKDASGTRCAVANLVYLDGHGDLVDRMAVSHNDVVVADETSGPLHDWVLTSGLTNEEVRRIQGAGFEFFGDNNVAWLDRSIAERDRVQSQLRAVEKELVASTDASLDLAASRLEGSPSSSRLALR